MPIHAPFPTAEPGEPYLGERPLGGAARLWLLETSSLAWPPRTTGNTQAATGIQMHVQEVCAWIHRRAWDRKSGGQGRNTHNGPVPRVISGSNGAPSLIYEHRHSPSLSTINDRIQHAHNEPWSTRGERKVLNERGRPVGPAHSVPRSGRTETHSSPPLAQHTTGDLPSSQTHKLPHALHTYSITPTAPTPPPSPSAAPHRLDAPLSLPAHGTRSTRSLEHPEPSSRNTTLTASPCPGSLFGRCVCRPSCRGDPGAASRPVSRSVVTIAKTTTQAKSSSSERGEMGSLPTLGQAGQTLRFLGMTMEGGRPERLLWSRACADVKAAWDQCAPSRPRESHCLLQVEYKTTG